MKCLANDDDFEPTEDQIRKSKSNISKYLKLHMIKNKDLINPEYSGLKLNRGIIVFPHLAKESRHILLNKSALSSDHSIETKDYLIREIID